MAQNGLLDFLQGASNAAASNVSAPVDGLAWLLRKAGIPVPDAPIGGSDWMAKKGLTAKPQNYLAGLLGESVGGVAPIVAAAKAPQIAKGLLQVEANAAAPTTLRRDAGVINFPGSPSTLYHGSARPFERFDRNLLGSNTGMGDAKIGFHFSDNHADADFYAEMAARAAGLDVGHVGKFDVAMRKPLVISPFAEHSNAPPHLMQDFLDNKNLAHEFAMKNGYDGIVYPHGTNVDSGYTAIAFDPEQITKLKATQAK